MSLRYANGFRPLWCRALCSHEQVPGDVVLDLFRDAAPIAGHQLEGRGHRHVPAVATEPIAPVLAFFEVPQFVGAGDLALRVHFGEYRADAIHPLAPARPGL